MYEMVSCVAGGGCSGGADPGEERVLDAAAVGCAFDSRRGRVRGALLFGRSLWIVFPPPLLQPELTSKSTSS